MTTSVHNVSKYIVQNIGAPISNLKLQKLLYYVQGWNLGLYGEPVFDEQIQAWIHGPVVPAVFQRFREFKWNPVQVDATPACLKQEFANHVMAVLSIYGKLTAAQLETLSHQEDPWKQAREGIAPKAPSKATISHESMKRYFGKLAHG
jgi:uncharacterized phage-associated protein